MNTFPKQDDVIHSVLEGALVAKKNYTSWTCDELYLSSAPSNFIRVHIAQELAKLDEKPEIFMDATISDILRCSLPNRRDFKAFMKENSLQEDTFSLTLDERFVHQNDNDSVSRVVISVQSGVRNVKEEYKEEIHKMCKMLSRQIKTDSTLDYGLFTFYLDISNTARKKAAKRIDEIIASFDVVVSQYDNLKSGFKGGEITSIENIGEWCVGCYIIEPTV